VPLPWWIGGISSGLLAYALFPGIMPLIISFFDVQIIRVIENHDYPEAKRISEAHFWPEFWYDVRFALRAIFLNIIVLPLYLVPVLNLFLFYLLNGYLLGSEFFMMVACRHVNRADSIALYRKHRGMILRAGMVIALLASIPLLNLLAPFWGIAVMVHLYHGLDKTLPVVISTDGRTRITG